MIRSDRFNDIIADIRLQIAIYLKAHPGHAFCDNCLAAKLGLGAREVHHARIGLAGSQEFEQHSAFCSSCLTMKNVIHVAWLHFDAPDDDAPLPYGA
jgi:hypothetical protein